MRDIHTPRNSTNCSLIRASGTWPGSSLTGERSPPSDNPSDHSAHVMLLQTESSYMTRRLYRTLFTSLFAFAIALLVFAVCTFFHIFWLRHEWRCVTWEIIGRGGAVR